MDAGQPPPELVRALGATGRAGPDRALGAGEIVLPDAGTPDGIPCAATVTLASHGGAGGPVALEVRAPDGWHTSWTRRAVDLAPGGHERIPLSVVPAPGAGPGEHLVLILATTPEGEFEDVLPVTAPGGPVPAGLWVAAPEPAVTVAPGARGLVRARIGATGVRTALTGRAYAVSPYGTWQLIAPASLPLHIPADGVAEVGFALRPPLDAPRGTTGCSSRPPVREGSRTVRPYPSVFRHA
ncbi:NEW3 domain-containing protein [Streptomyces sp. NPDC090131]|uniref:COG1470 family protein n=1 Tax=Streptomyces sp. NPDC090131 TaxID=3365954 RepID=UPI00381FC81C